MTRDGIYNNWLICNKILFILESKGVFFFRLLVYFLISISFLSQINIFRYLFIIFRSSFGILFIYMWLFSNGSTRNFPIFNIWSINDSFLVFMLIFTGTLPFSKSTCIAIGAVRTYLLLHSSCSRSPHENLICHIKILWRRRKW